MATQMTPNLGAVGSKRPYRMMRIPLSPHQEAEDTVNQIAGEGYVLKTVIPDGTAMVCLFELKS